MIGVILNGALVILWLVIWAFGGPLFLPAILIGLVGMAICFAIEVSA